MRVVGERQQRPTTRSLSVAKKNRTSACWKKRFSFSKNPVIPNKDEPKYCNPEEERSVVRFYTAPSETPRTVSVMLDRLWTDLKKKRF